MSYQYQIWVDIVTGTWGSTEDLVFLPFPKDKVDEASDLIDEMSESTLIEFAKEHGTKPDLQIRKPNAS